MRFRTLQAAPLMQLRSSSVSSSQVRAGRSARGLAAVIAHLNPVTLLLEAGRSLIAGTPTRRLCSP
jgi:hypothetical protein